MCKRPLRLLENTTFLVDKSHLSEYRSRLLPTPLKLRLAKSRLALKAKSAKSQSSSELLSLAKSQPAMLQLAMLQSAT